MDNLENFVKTVVVTATLPARNPVLGGQSRWFFLSSGRNPMPKHTHRRSKAKSKQKRKSRHGGGGTGSSQMDSGGFGPQYTLPKRVSNLPSYGVDPLTHMAIDELYRQGADVDAWMSTQHAPDFPVSIRRHAQRRRRQIHLEPLITDAFLAVLARHHLLSHFMIPDRARIANDLIAEVLAAHETGVHEEEIGFVFRQLVPAFDVEHNNQEADRIIRELVYEFYRFVPPQQDDDSDNDDTGYY